MKKSSEKNINEYIKKLEGIYKKGYGCIAKMVMTDTNLSIQSKALYAYLLCFVNEDSSVFVIEKTICFDLNISKYVLNKYLNELVEKRYLERDVDVLSYDETKYYVYCYDDNERELNAYDFL